MLHREAPSRAAIDATPAANTRFLVDKHCRTPFRVVAANLRRKVSIAVDRGQTLRCDHFNTVLRADLNTPITQDAASRVDEDVELALEAATCSLQASFLRQSKLDFAGR